MDSLLLKSGAYCRLARLHQPIGILLLLCPTLWGLFIAADSLPATKWFFIFIAGTIVTRSLGCVVNDMFDRDLDRAVARTQARPLAAGIINTTEAAVLALVLTALAAALWWQLPPAARLWCIPALAIIIIYPLCKRFFIFPQGVLGIAFGGGILITSTVYNPAPTAEAWCFFITNLLWVVAYDTLYAMSDRNDDEQYNNANPARRIYSTAILFGRYDVQIVSCLYAATILLLSAYGVIFHYGIAYQVSLIAAMLLIFRFYRIYKTREPAACLAIFCANPLFGACILLGIIAAKAV